MRKKSTKDKTEYIEFTQYETRVNPESKWYNFKDPFIKVPVRKYKVAVKDLQVFDDEN